MKLSKQKIILIGPYPDGQLNHIGGTTILFKNFVDYLESNKVLFSFISTIKYEGFGQTFFNLIYVLLLSFIKIPSSGMLVLNINRRGLYYLTPVLFCYAKLFGSKIALRMFGEFAKDELLSATPLIRVILLTIIRRVDLLFFETMDHVEFFKKYKSGSYWFPNCRAYPVRFNPKEYKKKFVYVGQVKIDKGILIILDAFKGLGQDYSLEIYGPILDDELFFIKDLPCYKGVLPFEGVYDALNRNDVLLLPTFYSKEGYPGIIIEAYSMSVPVITTKWKSIPEIVIDEVSGYLIESKSVVALKQSILKLNPETYNILNKGAFEISKKFQSDDVHKGILTIIMNSMKNH